ncbi:MAG: ribonuclease P protein component [Pseudomonadales bacterium]
MASPDRLTRTADLALVRREGKRVRTALLEVRVLASLLHAVPCSRIGLVVPKHRQTAVARNRLKRRLRALTREHWAAAFADMPPRDVALYALPSAYHATFEALRGDVQRLGAKVAALPDVA